jgi:signal transduction histidine kinase
MRIFDQLSLKNRFAVLLILIYAVSLPVISIITYYVLKQHAIATAYDSARLYLSFFNATRHYVGDELRPVLQRTLPDRFILEGMSRSYVAGSIARGVSKEHPGYLFKHASLNPRNPANRADELEREIINRFRDDREPREWKGLITKGGGRYYVLARSGSDIETSCLACHGLPEKAPKEMVAKYGTVAGFHLQQGEIIDAMVAYIPVRFPIADARNTVALFVGIYTLFFGTLLFLINRRFDWFYQKIESDKKVIEDIDEEVMNLNREIEDVVAERTMGMFGLKVADRIRNPVTVIGGICRRLTKEEKESIPRDKLLTIISECDRMEKIVGDFDELVRTKRFLFKREDLNEIASTTVKLMERTIEEARLKLIVKLSPRQLMFNANRQLFKMSIRHLISNAVDASSPGGEIIIASEGDGDSVCLIIKDTGRGMSSEEMHRIFEPFYSTKGRTGMGLPLVRQIVSEHLGEVTLESQPGSGTTVRLRFPSRWKEE